MERQRILTREDRPRLWAVLDEAVIRRVVGGPEVMREQLRHLIDCAEQGKTTLQVVPFGAGAHAGTTGPFVILDFPEPTDPMSCTSRPWPGTSTSKRLLTWTAIPLHLPGCSLPPCIPTTRCAWSSKRPAP